MVDRVNFHSTASDKAVTTAEWELNYRTAFKDVFNKNKEKYEGGLDCVIGLDCEVVRGMQDNIRRFESTIDDVDEVRLETNFVVEVYTQV